MSSQRDSPSETPAGDRRRAELLRLAREVVGAAGADLVDVELHGSTRKPLARVFVDVPGGTTAEACGALSRALEERLDAGGPLGERYTLEVSSPGLDRPLRTRRDFERLRGRSVEVQLADPEAGSRQTVGVLEDVEAGEGEGFWIRLRPAGREPVRIRAADIASARAHMPW